MSVDRDEWVSVPVDRFIRYTEKAILVEVDGDEYWVAKSQIDNLMDIEKHLAHPTSDSSKVEEIEVPMWMAIENGWEEEE